MTKKEKIIYIAGFFDGEGCFSMREKHDNKENTYGISILLTNTDLRPLQLTQKVFGGKISTRSRKKANWKTTYDLKIHTFKACADMCRQIKPYLIIKKERCLLYLKWCELRMKKRNPKIIERSKQGRIIKKGYIGYSKKELAIYNRVRKLNKRGQKVIKEAAQEEAARDERKLEHES